MICVLLDTRIFAGNPSNVGWEVEWDMGWEGRDNGLGAQITVHGKGELCSWGQEKFIKLNENDSGGMRL